MRSSSLKKIVRSPAEWEEQAATWLSFPRHPKNWAGQRGVQIKAFYFNLMYQIAKFQPVKLLIPKKWELPQEEANAFLKCRFAPQAYMIATNDIWIRDYGPFFVKRGEEKEIVQTKFNAWGVKFPPFLLDNKVPSEIAKKEKLPISDIPYIFEGGALEVNDDGLAITTLECLVGKNRNNPKDIKKIILALSKKLGLRDILVLPKGLDGDHTDGHIDNLARFVKTDRIVVASEDDPTSPNYDPLIEAQKLIKTWLKKHYGNKAIVDTLLLPPQKKMGKETLPASYMNFIFVNSAIIYPSYDVKTDKKAKTYFKSVFPDRKIIGIDCRTVIQEGGSLHCLSKHEPA